MSLYAIILAAGCGKRLKTKKPKAFVKINKQEIFKYSFQTFLSTKKFKKIVLVVPQKFNKRTKGAKVVVGGKNRNESFEKGIQALGNLNKKDKIFVHDAARIFVLKKDIEKLIKLKNDTGTLCYLDDKNKLGKSDFMFKRHHIQTPQYCTYEIYKKAKKNSDGKDLFTYLNIKFSKTNLVLSSNKHLNFKITHPDDIKVAELLVK